MPEGSEFHTEGRGAAMLRLWEAKVEWSGLEEPTTD